MTAQGSTSPPKLRLHSRESTPFLKWAGGKRGMVARLKQYVPSSYRTYCEPFLGGGALFFNLVPANSFLSDLNSELITTYRVVRDSPRELIAALSRHYYDKDYYYQIRSLDPASLSSIEVAARMIYLNRSGFNGLYRVNKKGEFNVPFGRYTNPTIVDTERIMACSDALKGAVIENLPFQELPWDMFGQGDFVYFDPPYIPVSKTSSFTAYQGGGFGEAEQLELANLFRRLDSQGVSLLLTNSGHERVKELYEGFKIISVPMLRMINSKADRRNAVEEFLITNC